MSNDPDRQFPRSVVSDTRGLRIRQLEPFVSAPNIDPITGFPITRQLSLSGGIYRLNIIGLLPIAFRVTEQGGDDQWFNDRRGEVLRFFQEPVVRLVQRGESILWRPLFDFAPFPELNVTLLARPDTYGG